MIIQTIIYALISDATMLVDRNKEKLARMLDIFEAATVTSEMQLSDAGWPPAGRVSEKKGAARGRDQPTDVS
jgi:hypothetical protein